MPKVPEQAEKLKKIIHEINRNHSHLEKICLIGDKNCQPVTKNVAEHSCLFAAIVLSGVQPLSRKGTDGRGPAAAKAFLPCSLRQMRI